MYLPKPGEGGNFTPVPAGTFPGICYRVIDMGTQDEMFQGEAKRLHKVMLSFELKDDECVMRGGEYDGKPMTIHPKYTLSMSEKANLRKHLETWRGKAFTESDFGPGGFNMAKLLRVPCLLSITQNEGKNGGIFSNVRGISKLPKQMVGAIGELVNETIYVSLDRELFDPEAFGKLSDTMRSKIMASPEYQALASPTADEEEDGNRWARPIADDEIPF